MVENRIIELEIRVAYQEDLLLSLNDIIATQQQQINRLEYAYKSIHERVLNLTLKLPEELESMHEIPPHY